MNEFQYNSQKDSFFDESICSRPNVLFHGSSFINHESILKNGIAKPSVPKEIESLIEKHSQFEQNFGFTHAFNSYGDTYGENMDNVFLAEICTHAGRYVKNNGGERINALRISIDQLIKVFEPDSDVVSNRIAYTEQAISSLKFSIHLPGKQEEVEKLTQRLDILRNTAPLRPLLEESIQVKEKYPTFFNDVPSKRVVYAIDTTNLKLSGDSYNGYTCKVITPEDIIAFSLVNREPTGNCMTCIKRRQV